MRAPDIVRLQLRLWHAVIDEMLRGMEHTINDRIPGANIVSMAAIYAHVVMAEDVFVHGVQAKPPIFQSGHWEANTGVPFIGSPPTMTEEWAARVQMDLSRFNDYAALVYADTESYLSSVPDDALDRPLGQAGFTLGYVLANVIGAHAPQHAGEIAALKGVRGETGLPDLLKIAQSLPADL